MPQVRGSNSEYIRVVAVVHPSRSPEAPILAARIAKLAALMGAEVVVASLDEAPKLCTTGRIKLLLAVRGGHAASVEEACGEAETLPPRLVASIVYSRLEPGEDVVLLYAARRREVVDSVEAIASALEELGVGVAVAASDRIWGEARLVRGGVGGRRCAVQPLAVLPGALESWATRVAVQLGCRPLPALARGAGASLIAAWLAGKLLSPPPN